MRRAAKELRSKILELADLLRKQLIHKAGEEESGRLARIDFNQIYTGTLDGLAEQVLTDFRAPGSPPPIIVDEQTADMLMLREGLFREGRFRKSEVKAYAKLLNGTSYGLSASQIAACVREVHDRCLYDDVDLAAFRAGAGHLGAQEFVDAILDYRQALSSNNWFDYSTLETRFEDKLREGLLTRFAQSLRVVLVDEYQDTNFLQERIYFEMARSAVSHGGGVSVVGDDDQALYRFRGATTELFTAFAGRAEKILAIRPAQVYLKDNRRSTSEVVSWVNAFATLDPGYQAARVAGKPQLVVARRSPPSLPILGMFRPTADILAHDLAEVVDKIVNGGGFKVGSTNVTIQRDRSRGSAADIVLLESSPEEWTSADPPAPRLPLLLRRELMQLAKPLLVYNPRGQPAASVPEVAQLLGLLLECIDPGSNIETATANLPREATAQFQSWRLSARGLIASNPRPLGPPSLSDFVGAWASRNPTRGGKWPRKPQSVLELIYKLVTWIPPLQSDIEALAYLELVNRVIDAGGALSKFDGCISYASSTSLEQSVRDVLWNAMVPLALDLASVDEDLMETLPANRVGIFSIHQAKGLEFPLTIVDVGSSFKVDHHTQRRQRFPTAASRVSLMEDMVRQFSPLSSPARPPVDREFDDLVRKYFVSYSRAQDVLILVGLDSNIGGNGIRNVALGWRRDGSHDQTFTNRITLV